jgi:hypothetical protein
VNPPRPWTRDEAARLLRLRLSEGLLRDDLAAVLAGVTARDISSAELYARGLKPTLDADAVRQLRTWLGGEA